MLCALVAAVASFSTGRAADSPASSPWKEYPLGQSGDLQAVVRVKPVASMADADWLIVEITNNGPAARISSGTLAGPASWGTHSASDLLSGLVVGISSGNRAARSMGNTLPAGKFTTAEPGVRMGARFGFPSSDEAVSISITLDLKLDDGRALHETAQFTTTWTKPTAAQLPALQKETADLLAKAVAGPVRPYNPTINRPPPRLSGPESNRLGMLLQSPEIAQGVTLEQALANIKLHQQEGTLPGDDTGALMDIVIKNASDPVVIAFYREALTVRGGEAIRDLRASLRKVGTIRSSSCWLKTLRPRPRSWRVVAWINHASQWRNSRTVF